MATKQKDGESTKVMTESTDEQELPNLVAEMERLMALDRILEARKIVDSIYQQYPDGALTKTQRNVMSEIVSQANRVSKMLHDLQSDEGWTLARAKHGVTVHYRHEPPSPIHAIKTRTVFENVEPCDFIHLCSIFVESDLTPLWFPRNILKGMNVLARPTNYHQILHTQMAFGRFSPIAPRDSVLDGRGYHLSNLNGVLVFLQSIEESEYCQVPPPRSPCVRMDTKMAFFIQLLPKKRMVFCQISHDNLKIKYMPAWLLNFLAEGTIPFETVISLRKTLANFSGSQWEQRVQSKRSIYDEIEDRLAEELAIIEQQGEGAMIDYPPEWITTSTEQEERRPYLQLIVALIAVWIAVVLKARLGWDAKLLVACLILAVMMIRLFQVTPADDAHEELTPAPTALAVSNKNVPKETSGTPPMKKAKKRPRKSVKLLVRAVSAPIGLVRKRSRRKGKAEEGRDAESVR